MAVDQREALIAAVRAQVEKERAEKQKKLEWLESGERGEIERNFGVGKRRYMLDQIVTKLKETSETSIHISVLYMNLRKKLRLLLRNFSIQLTKIVVCEKIVDCV